MHSLISKKLKIPPSTLPPAPSACKINIIIVNFIVCVHSLKVVILVIVLVISMHMCLTCDIAGYQT